MGELELQNPEISILLLDNPQIAELNKAYLDRKGPTDVISFPMNDGTFPNVQPQILGDVVISVETAFSQAAEKQWPVQEEIAALLIHGILHLLGYDHETSDSENKRMKKMEIAILSKIVQDQPFTD